MRVIWKAPTKMVASTGSQSTGSQAQTLAVMIAAFAITILNLANPVQAQTQTPAGDVASVEGRATAAVASKERALAKGTAVFVDETITTDAAARVMLNLGRDTTIRLGEKVRIRIERHMVNAGGSFDLNSGAILFDRGAGAPKATTTVRSPYGLLAVRGTTVFAGPSNGVFGVFVVHGRVDVTAGGTTVQLKRGLGTNIANPGDAPTKPASWKAPRIKAALASVGDSAR
jgi:hypothetical protein